LKKAQRFTHGRLERLNLVLYVEKDEKKFLEELATAFRRNGRQRSGLATAVVTLLRVGATCIREHIQEEDLPSRITTQEALEAGLTVPPHNPKLRFGRDSKVEP
jgi:hypothetical protein